MKNNEKLANYQAKQDLIAQRKLRGPKDNKLALLIAGAALALAFVGQTIYFNFGPGVQSAEEAAVETSADPEASSEETESPTNDPNVPSPELAENRTWTGAMNLGGSDIGFELDGTAAPQAVANFVSLAQKGYFENVSCHRLTTEGIFVLQCGDPSGDGTGGPGYNWGPIEAAPANDLYQEGVIAMARRGGDGFSMGSQFFIVYQDSTIPSDSAGGYTVLGRLTGGLDAVKAIAAKGTANGTGDGAPAEPVVMTGISVE
jgi:peptidyl-prolyl cis-trans isomerase B (cyclophilin B)